MSVLKAQTTATDTHTVPILKEVSTVPAVPATGGVDSSAAVRPAPRGVASMTEYDAAFHCSTEINECAEDLDNCHANAKCINTAGSYQCRCKSGFRGNGRTCTGQPRTGHHPLSNSRQTIQLSFLFFCTAIEDINECAKKNRNRCHRNADCIDLPKGYRCECRDGYVGNGRRCRGMFTTLLIQLLLTSVPCMS